MDSLAPDSTIGNGKSQHIDVFLFPVLIDW
jgi:hypothetical protein